MFGKNSKKEKTLNAMKQKKNDTPTVRTLPYSFKPKLDFKKSRINQKQ